jgi:F-type H+-transporting ATPase subunit b
LPCSLYLFTFFFLLFTASAVYASGGGEAGAEHGQSLFKAYLWPVVNFLVLVFLMVFMMKKMDIKGYFSKRTELIEQTLKEAKEAKALAERALAEVEEKLRVKDREIGEIMAYAKQSAEKEKVRLAEEGEGMKAKILEQTRNNIDYELKKAKETIKEEAVLIAMELAEKKIREKLTTEEQIKLLEESLAKIEGKN